MRCLYATIGCYNACIFTKASVLQGSCVDCILIFPLEKYLILRKLPLI